jgi:hypothetical protein
MAEEKTGANAMNSEPWLSNNGFVDEGIFQAGRNDRSRLAS